MEKNNYIILVEYLAKKIPNVDALSYFTHPKFWIETYKKILEFQNIFPEIKIILLPWSGSQHCYLKRDEVDDKIRNLFVNVETTVGNTTDSQGGIMGYLQNNKLQMWNAAKAWNGNYKYNHKEEHASIEGHKRVANIVINYIKKLEDDKKR